MVPSASMTPARNSSATTSMMPEPQMPVMPTSGSDSAKPGSSLHRSEPMTLQPRFERVAVDAHPLDRAGRGPLAARDLRALERRAGRARRRREPVAVAEHDLGVGADVDQQHDLVAAVRARRRASPPAVSAPTWPAMHGRMCSVASGQAMPMSVGLAVDGQVGGERERRAAERRRVDAEDEVVHDRVADEHDVGDLAHPHRRRRCDCDA